ncbi:hypothetical protein O1611_g5576 [Lasiodiplodia mahajangana]|uniref:Uncharacterized protein n=1 Tax=Lasiodiplodia mahajangana TaxID=1108764 RepID=A0ACC2JKI6_9PEZI|nr:hypothetical protein O1611_g5576 [Lasiodiplodia mahajangana]
MTLFSFLGFHASSVFHFPTTKDQAGSLPPSDWEEIGLRRDIDPDLLLAYLERNHKGGYRVKTDTCLYSISTKKRLTPREIYDLHDLRDYFANGFRIHPERRPWPIQWNETTVSMYGIDLHLLVNYLNKEFGETTERYKIERADQASPGTASRENAKHSAKTTGRPELTPTFPPPPYSPSTDAPPAYTATEDTDPMEA